MRVYKCDRCGRFFRHDELLLMIKPKRNVLFDLRGKEHICRYCAYDFKRWWDSPNCSETTAKLLRNEVRNDPEA
jgi:hypothetical protein